MCFKFQIPILGVAQRLGCHRHRNGQHAQKYGSRQMLVGETILLAESY